MCLCTRASKINFRKKNSEKISFPGLPDAQFQMLFTRKKFVAIIIVRHFADNSKNSFQGFFCSLLGQFVVKSRLKITFQRIIVFFFIKVTLKKLQKIDQTSIFIIKENSSLLLQGFGNSQRDALTSTEIIFNL